MIGSKRAMRRAVLSEMFDVLDHVYGVDVPRDQFVEGVLSLHEIDGILSFKTDPRLDDLRGALSRIEEGTFGVCIGCKRPIGAHQLHRDPARRMCNICEREFNKPAMDAQFDWAHL